MNQRRELPPELIRGPFLARDATQHGVAAHRLRAHDLNREFWGVREADAGELSLERRCALLMTRLPEAAFVSHATAALLWHIPLPPRLAARPLLDISVPAPARAPHAHGISGHSMAVEDSDTVRWASGITVTTPVRTWLDLGSRLPLLDLVAAGDFLISRANPIATLEQLAEGYRRRKSRRGLRTLLESFSHLDAGSESPQESRLRTIIRLAGLPVPRVNTSVHTTAGEFIARTDLYIEEYRLVIEYQGDYHRDKAQWRKDMTRRSRLEATGRRVLELNADDLRDPLELASRIRKLAGLPHLELDIH
jgi:very-short-patch-repair endonuclease